MPTCLVSPTSRSSPRFCNLKRWAVLRLSFCSWETECETVHWSKSIMYWTWLLPIQRWQQVEGVGAAVLVVEPMQKNLLLHDFSTTVVIQSLGQCATHTFLITQSPWYQLSMSSPLFSWTYSWKCPYRQHFNWPVLITLILSICILVFISINFWYFNPLWSTVYFFL